MHNAITDQGVDTDNNGLFNTLQFTIPVDIEQAGSYRVNGTLIDNEGHVIAAIDQVFMLSGGANAITLDIGGGAVGRYGTDGPYELIGLSISLETDIHVASPVMPRYSTQAYTSDQFEQMSRNLYLPLIQR
jgi:hypothetical protein